MFNCISHFFHHWSWRTHRKSGTNPTIAGYHASVVNFYNATGSLARLENKNILFYFEKRCSLLKDQPQFGIPSCLTFSHSDWHNVGRKWCIHLTCLELHDLRLLGPHLVSLKSAVQLFWPVGIGSLGSLTFVSYCERPAGWPDECLKKSPYM
jgi:hypothetical protein